jgi:ATP-binding cassette subfamily F protein uup
MHGAWLSFSDAPLLDDTELHIEDNERVCLVGRNGAGKSTLMKILNREQGLDDGRIVYEQDLIVSRLQQDPPRNVAGTVYDFVAEGISEQAEYLKGYHEISHLVMTDPSEKTSMRWLACKSCWIITACGSLKAVSLKCWIN